MSNQFLNNLAVILGPPGTGKTYSLMEILEIEMADGVLPEEIAFNAFTKAASEEVKNRMARQFKLDRKELPWFRTIHSAAHGLLGLKKGDMADRKAMKAFASQYSYTLTLDRRSGGSGMFFEPPTRTEDDNLRAVFEWCRHRIRPISEGWIDCGLDIEYDKLELYVRNYSEFKTEKGLLDFHDILEKAVIECPPPPVKIAFIDECQDLSPLMIKTVTEWYGGCNRKYCGGDDDQAIYNWMGADSSWIIELSESAKEVIKLDQSYRVPRLPYILANRIISRNVDRVKKEYKPMNRPGAIKSGSSRDAVNKIRETIKTKYRRAFILIRNRKFDLDWINLLKDNRIPYYYEGGYDGLNPFSKVKPCRAIMSAKMLLDGKDITATQLRSMFDFIPAAGNLPKGVKTVKAKKNKNPVNMDELIMMWGMGDFFKRLKLEGPASVLREETQETQDYLSDVLEDHGDLEKLQKNPPVRLMTVHGSKGREANLVVLDSDMVYPTFKGMQDDPEPENRVAYVAITRTKWDLFLVYPTTDKYFPYQSYLHGLVK